MNSTRLFRLPRYLVNQRRLAMSSSPLHLPTSPDVQTIRSLQATYENAVITLNQLQSNAQTIAKARENKELTRSKTVPHTLGALQTSGLDLDTVERLGIIHVAGTKGKGMTCAFTESILRHAGLKTGFFSSPHLSSVRERIRINGKPISEDTFTNHFFSLYEKIKHLKEPNAPYEMPHYFRFLTCMAFHVFVEEKVDVVILEVGIGGLFDSTNVIKKPVVVGVTSLGLEHQMILGNTLEEIAYQKAGIMKKNVPAYTLNSHPPHIEQILRSYAEEIQCPLYCVSDSDFKNGNLNVNLSINDGIVSQKNAMLAIHLANEFISQKHPHLFPSSPANGPSSNDLIYSNPSNYLPFHIKGLESTKWHGRFQILHYSKEITYYLDGAHTDDSLNIALKWFKKVSNPSAFHILVFNITGERSAQNFLQLMSESGLFDFAIFCPLVISTQSQKPDNWAALNANTDIMVASNENLKIWTNLHANNSKNGTTCPCAKSTVQHICNLYKEGTPVNVLITGSVRLVGTFLSVLDPKMNE